MTTKQLEKLGFEEILNTPGDSIYRKDVSGLFKHQSFSIYHEINDNNFWCVLGGASIKIKSIEKIKSILNLIN